MVATRHRAPATELVRLGERRLARAEADALAAVRREAWRRFLDTGIPTSRVEDWKYARVDALLARPFAVPGPAEPAAGTLAAAFAGGPRARRLILANGRVLAGPSHVGGLPAGMRVLSLAEAIARFPERVAEALAEVPDPGPFTDLNTALAEDGAWIELEEGVRPDFPLQLLLVAVGEPSAVMAHPRVVVRLGAGARLHLIESHLAEGTGHVLTNLVLQVRLAGEAELVHEKLQAAEGGHALLTRTSVRLAAGARLRDRVATAGGDFVRNELDVRLEGEGGEALMAGLYLPRGREQVDTLVRVHHHAGRCHSDQFYKGVVEDRARAAFAGRITVHPGAQDTDAYQQNRNLLLSDEAEVDAKPELEIFADEVRCSHGATVGGLDEAALFYLRTRGMAREAAEALLTYAFAGEVVARFDDPGLAAQVRRAILARVPGGGMLDPEGLVA